MADKCHPINGINRILKNFCSEREFDLRQLGLSDDFRENSNFEQKITFFYNKKNFEKLDTVTLYAIPSKSFLLEMERDMIYTFESLIDLANFNSFFCPKEIDLHSDLDKLLFVHKDRTLIELDLFSKEFSGNVEKEFREFVEVSRLVDSPKEGSDVNKKIRVRIDGYFLSNIIYRRYLPFLRFAKSNMLPKELVRNFEHNLHGGNINIRQLISEHFESARVKLKAIDLEFDNLNICLNGKKCTIDSTHIITSYKLIFLTKLKVELDEQYSL